MVYLIPIILFAIGIFRYDYLKRDNGRIFLWIIICVYLILLAGLRYKIGEDTFQYLWEYDRVNPIDKFKPTDFQKSRFAPGFILIFSFFKMLSPEMVYFQLFQSTIVNLVIFYFLFKNTNKIFFAGILYYFFLYYLFCFQELREALAVSIFLLVWPAFKQNKWLIWYLASILAFTMHLSAIIMFFLPAICLPGIRNFFTFGKIKTLVIILSITIITFILYQKFFIYIELISISEKMQDRAQVYGKNGLGGAISNFKIIISTIIEYAIYPLFILYILNKRRAGNHKYFDKLDAFVLINIYIVFFSLFIIVGGRLMNYFFPFVILLLSDFIFSIIKINGKKYAFNFLFWIIFFSPMFVLHEYRQLYSNINDSGTLKSYMAIYPYNSYIYKVEDENQQRTYRILFKSHR